MRIGQMVNVLTKRTLLRSGLVVASLLYGSVANAQFIESWESPSIAAGMQTSAAGFNNWVAFAGSPTNMLVQHPNTTAAFNQVQPLAGPAGGNQLLSLSGPNTGIYRMSSITIQANRQYTLSAAIGNSMADPSSATWSLQLWADANDDGEFDGSLGDTFIGQQFGTSGTAINPLPGEWATNSFTFDSATTPNLVGMELIVFLNNNTTVAGGVSYYDNVIPVPEPSTTLGVAALALYGIRAAYRRRHREIA